MFGSRFRTSARRLHTDVAFPGCPFLHRCFVASGGAVFSLSLPSSQLPNLTGSGSCCVDGLACLVSVLIFPGFFVAFFVQYSWHFLSPVDYMLTSYLGAALQNPPPNVAHRFVCAVLPHQVVHIHGGRCFVHWFQKNPLLVCDVCVNNKFNFDSVPH